MLTIRTKNLFAYCLVLFICGFAPLHGKDAPARPASSHRVAVRDSVFYSASLKRDMHYRAIVPRSYDLGESVPVLYLLHGLYGDYQNWDTRTGLENYAQNLHWLIVMPDADDSWYTNSATVPADRFEDYIAKDLIAEIDKKYRTIHDRYGRAIAGLSMGGYGAVKLGLKYPELFAFAGSLSGAFNASQDLDRLRPEFRAKLLEVFGNERSETRTENDIFRLLNTPHQVAYPYFYLACGSGDFFLDTNRAFARELSSKKLAYEYHETFGAHTWEYWDRALKPLLTAPDEQMRESPPHSK